MKNLVINCLLLFMCLKTSAQLSGVVLNEQSKPLIGANVQLLKQVDSAIIKSTITNEEGKYDFQNIKQGKYMIHVSAIGYKDFFLPEINYNNTPKEIEKIEMVIATAELQQVIVRAEKPLLKQTAEGTVVNVENSILTKGSTALQILERSPGVIINKRDNSIELNGKSGVTVMLNGKLLRMSESQLVELLSGMSGDDIVSIELITSPSAKYDAEGTAGIINIVLKKNKLRGTTGSINLSAGYGYREKATAGFTIAHNTSNLNLYGSYNFSHNNTYSNMFVDSWQQMAFLGGAIHAIGYDTTKAQYNNHNINVGADLKLNTTTTISANIIYGKQQSLATTWSHLDYNVLPDSLLNYDGLNKGKNAWSNVVTSLSLEKTFSKSGKLNASVDYLHYTNNGGYNVTGTFINKHGETAGGTQVLSAPAQKGFAETGIDVFVSKADYSTALNKQIQLEAGIKTSNAKSNSHAGFESLVNGEWKSDPQTVNNILMRENIYAAYASLKTSIKEKLQITTGIRYENTFTTMTDAYSNKEVVRRAFASIFPNISATKKINDNEELQLSYTKRITRPTYNDLASYVGYSDPTAVITGNSFLQPTISNNIKIGYSYKNYAFSFRYSYDKNTIARFQLTESPAHDILYVSPQNIPWLNSYTLQAILPVKINKWWTMNYTLMNSIFSYKVTHTNKPFVHTYYNYYLQTSQSFKLPKAFSAELSGSYYNVYYSGTQKVNGIVRMNIGFKKELKNNKGSLQLSVTDVLMQEKYDINFGTLTTEAFNIKNNVIVYTETTRLPVFRLSYSRTFGKTKASSNNQRKTIDEDDRISR